MFATLATRNGNDRLSLSQSLPQRRRPPIHAQDLARLSTSRSLECVKGQEN